MPSDLATFASLTKRFLDSSHRLFPQRASELGLQRYDGALGRNGPAVHQRYLALVTDTLAAVEKLPEGSFRGDDWLDRRAFLAQLRTDLLDYGELRRWRTNPQVHGDAAIQAIFSLVIKQARQLRKALPSIESRLKRLPAFLAEGASCVRAPVPLWTTLAVRTCEGADTFLAALEQTLIPLAPRASRLETLFAHARAAFKKYAAAIQRKQPGPENGFCIGRENFELLMRERLGLDWTIEEAEASGYRLIAELRAELKKEARKLGGGSPRQIIARAAAAWKPSAGSRLEEYEQVTRSVRAAFEEAGLMTFPTGDELRVMPVPDFLRHQFPTAAYHNPGPYEKKQIGIFWVNDLSEIRASAADQAREVEQHFGLELTCAHEAYPGHHLQFVLQNRHRSKLRRHFAHSIFYEGWTLWCEKMCLDQKIFRAKPARLLQLSDALWRAWRIVIDCGLHSGKLTCEEACQLLRDGAGFTQARAQGDINWYTASPTVPMSYLLGRLELEKLHAELTGRGWSLRQFNDWILSFGAIPWSWIWRSTLHGTPLPR